MFQHFNTVLLTPKNLPRIICWIYQITHATLRSMARGANLLRRSRAAKCEAGLYSTMKWCVSPLLLKWLCILLGVVHSANWSKIVGRGKCDSSFILRFPATLPNGCPVSCASQCCMYDRVDSWRKEKQRSHNVSLLEPSVTPEVCFTPPFRRGRSSSHVYISHLRRATLPCINRIAVMIPLIPIAWCRCQGHVVQVLCFSVEWSS